MYYWELAFRLPRITQLKSTCQLAAVSLENVAVPITRNDRKSSYLVCHYHIDYRTGDTAGLPVDSVCIQVWG